MEPSRNVFQNNIYFSSIFIYIEVYNALEKDGYMFSNSPSS